MTFYSEQQRQSELDLSAELARVVEAWASSINRDPINISGSQQQKVWEKWLPTQGVDWCLKAIEWDKKQQRRQPTLPMALNEYFKWEGTHKKPTATSPIVNRVCCICGKPATKTINSDKPLWFCYMHGMGDYYKQLK